MTYIETRDGMDVRHLTVCHTCAVILVNGDASMDGGEEKAERIEVMGGRWTPISEDEDGPGGYWTCAACDEVTIGGPAHVFEHEVRAG